MVAVLKLKGADETGPTFAQIQKSLLETASIAEQSGARTTQAQKLYNTELERSIALEEAAAVKQERRFSLGGAVRGGAQVIGGAIGAAHGVDDAVASARRVHEAAAGANATMLELRGAALAAKYALGTIGTAAANITLVGTVAVTTTKAVQALEAAGSKSAKSVADDFRSMGTNISTGYKQLATDVGVFIREQTQPARQMIADLKTAAKEFDETFSKEEGILKKTFRFVTGGSLSPEEKERGADLDSRIDGPRGLSSRVRARDAAEAEKRAAEDEGAARGKAWSAREKAISDAVTSQDWDRRHAGTVDKDQVQSWIDTEQFNLKKRITRTRFDEPDAEQKKKLAEAEAFRRNQSAGSEGEHQARMREFELTSPTSTALEAKRKESEALMAERQAQIEADFIAKKKEIMAVVLPTEEEIAASTAKILKWKELQAQIEKDRTAFEKDIAEHQKAAAEDEQSYQRKRAEKLKDAETDREGDALTKRAGELRQNADRERDRAQSRVDNKTETPAQAAKSKEKINQLEAEAAKLELKRFEARKNDLAVRKQTRELELAATKEQVRQHEEAVRAAKTDEQRKQATDDLRKNREKEVGLLKEIRDLDEKALSVDEERTRQVASQVALDERRAELMREHLAMQAEAMAQDRARQMGGALGLAMPGQAGGMGGTGLEGVDPEFVNLGAVGKIAEDRGQKAYDDAFTKSLRNGKGFGQANQAGIRARRAAEAKAWRAAKKQGIVRGGPRDYAKMKAGAAKGLKKWGVAAGKASSAAAAGGAITPDELIQGQMQALQNILASIQGTGQVSSQLVGLIRDAIIIAGQNAQNNAAMLQAIVALQNAVAALNAGLRNQSQVDQFRGLGMR